LWPFVFELVLHAGIYLLGSSFWQHMDLFSESGTILLPLQVGVANDLTASLTTRFTLAGSLVVCCFVTACGLLLLGAAGFVSVDTSFAPPLLLNTMLAGASYILTAIVPFEAVYWLSFFVYHSLSFFLTSLSVP
jgi:hypothetical protein